MPAINTSTIKDAKWGSIDLSAVYQGSTKIWENDSWKYQPFNLRQFNSGGSAWVGFNTTTQNQIYNIGVPFKVQMWRGGVWKNKADQPAFDIGIQPASRTFTYNGVTYYYVSFLIGPQAAGFDVRVAQAGVDEYSVWSGQNADKTVWTEELDGQGPFPYPIVEWAKPTRSFFENWLKRPTKDIILPDHLDE